MSSLVLEVTKISTERGRVSASTLLDRILFVKMAGS